MSSPSLSRSVWQRRALTLALAAAGAGLFWWLHLPLPFLFGPMAACLIAALAHVPIQGFGQVSVAARTILGVAVGASITPALFAELPRMAMSVALVPLFIALIGCIGVPFFRRIWGFDAPTAYYAAMPGGLQDMVIFGSEAGGDPRALSLVHATRVLIIVTLAPVFLTSVYGAGLTNPIGAPVSEVPAMELALMVAAALIGWKGGERIGLFGASILGPMIVTAALSLAGLIHIRPPREAILFAQFFIGCGIGVQFLGVTWSELTRVVAAGVAYVLVLALLAAGFTVFVSNLGLGDPVDAFLAFAPGGQAEMTVLAIVSGADLGFVITHHLTRIVLVIVGAPLVAGIIRRRRPLD
ncbi:AbrB family transcriptional regulator [Aliishimia ponticola]|uniref:AbrB family transcriptional regulator n=1 Tax=Aliishimia ponticola TaxID=2499833 RepID=A0A4S4NIW4_9RHOB|nr:AbrB family transcriptional regulator [Aliishimia ponticola]THH38151.1 AbrB family transcriptional regulator [Aliishimia ponticola]